MPFSRWSDTLRSLLEARPDLNADTAHRFWWLCKSILAVAVLSTNAMGVWLCLTLFGIVII
jgi:hypothetical protein